MDKKRRILEAIAECDNAMDTIDDALKQLNSAKNWGRIDLFGGGVVSSLAKNRKVGKSDKKIKELEKSMRRLEDEIGSIGKSLSYKKTGMITKYLDIAHDHFIWDWKSQSHIKKNIKTLKNLKKDLEYVREELEAEIERED